MHVNNEQNQLFILLSFLKCKFPTDLLLKKIQKHFPHWFKPMDIIPLKTNICIQCQQSMHAMKNAGGHVAVVMSYLG